MFALGAAFLSPELPVPLSWRKLGSSPVVFKKCFGNENGGVVLSIYLENSPEKTSALFGKKLCFYNLMETQN